MRGCPLFCAQKRIKRLGTIHMFEKMAVTIHGLNVGKRGELCYNKLLEDD